MPVQERTRHDVNIRCFVRIVNIRANLKIRNDSPSNNHRQACTKNVVNFVRNKFGCEFPRVIPKAISGASKNGEKVGLLKKSLVIDYNR